MPNHVTNILTLRGEKEDITECLKSIRSSKRENKRSYNMSIDFNKIIPMPESLKITSGSNVDKAIAVINRDVQFFRKMLSYPWAEKEGLTTVEQMMEYVKKDLLETDLNEGRQAISNLKLYGHKDWYSWSCANWGTKWNAYDQSGVKRGVKKVKKITQYHTAKIQFDTAWASPFPVFEKLAKKFPKLIVQVDFADEDLGNNCGTYVFQEGILITEYEPTKEESLKFACEIKGYNFHELICEYIEGWDLEQVKEQKETIIEILQEGKLSELVQNLDLKEENSKEILEYLKTLSVENEIYEAASKINEMVLSEE